MGEPSKEQRAEAQEIVAKAYGNAASDVYGSVSAHDAMKVMRMLVAQRKAVEALALTLIVERDEALAKGEILVAESTRHFNAKMYACSESERYKAELTKANEEIAHRESAGALLEQEFIKVGERANKLAGLLGEAEQWIDCECKERRHLRRTQGEQCDACDVSDKIKAALAEGDNDDD